MFVGQFAIHHSIYRFFPVKPCSKSGELFSYTHPSRKRELSADCRSLVRRISSYIYTDGLYSCNSISAYYERIHRSNGAIREPRANILFFVCLVFMPEHYRTYPASNRTIEANLIYI